VPWSTLRPSLPGKAEWFATMERAGVPMFNDVEEMAEAAGLLTRHPALRDSARGNSFSSVTIRTRHHP
jgi:acetyltransferase